jgi:hypothetical protein
MYQEYKQATKQFVNWIIQTSKIKTLPNTLSALKLHVQSIISDDAIPSEKEKDFSRKLVNALQSGKQAIELRSLVHSIYKSSSSSESNHLERDQVHEEHLVCINILKDCYSALKDWSTKFDRDAASKESAVNIHTELFPKFAGLEIEETTEINSELNLPEVTKFNFDETDLKFGDLRLRFICFFLEIIQMEEQVVDTWKRVKSMDISLISATVVTHFAIQRIKMIHSELSLLCPSYSDAASFFSGLKQFLSPLEYEWVSRHSSFQILHWTLEFYHQSARFKEKFNVRVAEMGSFIHCRGSFHAGQIYNECTGSPLESERNHIFNFLEHEVAILLQSLIEEMARGSDYETFPLGKNRNILFRLIFESLFNASNRGYQRFHFFSSLSAGFDRCSVWKIRRTCSCIKRFICIVLSFVTETRITS